MTAGPILETTRDRAPGVDSRKNKASPLGGRAGCAIARPGPKKFHYWTRPGGVAPATRVPYNERMGDRERDERERKCPHCGQDLPASERYVSKPAPPRRPVYHVHPERVYEIRGRPFRQNATGKRRAVKVTEERRAS